MNHIVAAILFCISFLTNGFAQSSAPIQLYLQTDKTIYQPGENIWFASYVLNRDEEAMHRQHFLYVLLVDAVNRKLVSQQRFAIESGLGPGFISLPDTLQPGNYWLIAYTNGYFQTGSRFFRQLITIKTEAVSPFRMLSEKFEGDSVRYKIGTDYGGLASNCMFAYTLWDGQDSITSGQLAIDAFGEVTIRGIRDKHQKRELTASVSRNSKTQTFILPLDPAYNEPGLEVAGTHLQITFDSLEYHRRGLVKMHVALKDSVGKPFAGILSMSVVHRRRTDTLAVHNIGGGYLDPIPMARLANEKFVADDMAQVYQFESASRKPIPLLLMGLHIGTFLTDSCGEFLIDPALLGGPGEWNYLSVADKGVDGYKISINSHSDTVNRSIAREHFPLNFNFEAGLEDQASPELPGMMVAAVVKYRKMEEFNEIAGEYNSRDCDKDYVWNYPIGLGDMGDPEVYNRILNDPFKGFRGSRTKPIEGQRYGYIKDKRPVGGGAVLIHIIPVIYHCKVPKIPAFMTPLPQITQRKPFPLHDYSVETSAFMQQTTLYWNDRIQLGKSGETDVSFYTDDVTGKFICHIQGITGSGTVSASAGFVVLP